MQRVALLIVLAVVPVGAAFANAAAGTVTINASSHLGTKILVSSNGVTLYHYMQEKKGVIKCTGACAKLWPPLLASTKLQAGPGVTAAKLGTIKRSDGSLQVTYNGLALYRHASDKKAGQTNGQGVDGQWFAVTTAGAVTKATSSPQVTGAPSGGATPGGTTTLPQVTCNPAVVVTDPSDPCYNTSH